MPTQYSRTQIMLHWAVVILLAVQFIFADAISHAWHVNMDSGTFTPTGGAIFHVVIGVLIGVLAIWRVVLRFTHGVPALPEKEPGWQKIIAHLTHWALYALLLLLPVSGAVAWFGMVGPAGGAHELFKALLILLVVLHVVAALYHQFVLRTNLLARMRPGA